MIQIYRECFEGEQPVPEFAFAESMYSEGKQSREQSSEQICCHCPVCLALDSKLIAAQLRSAIYFLRTGVYNDPG